MADWRPAPSVKLGLDEATHRWPDRSKASDGILGDAAHSSRTSDHNPAPNGVVHAFDLTHDPAHGVDCGQLSQAIVARKDRRLRYVIWNRRICKGPWSDGVMDGRADPWVWEPYEGLNPHDHHMHVSVGYSLTAENDTSPWYGTEEDDMYDADAEARLKKYIRDTVYRALLVTMSGQPNSQYSATNAAEFFDGEHPSIAEVLREVQGA